MTLINAMTTEDTTTSNGALAHSTTSNDAVDLFFHINAMRARTSEEIIKLWTPAFATSPLDALKILFYSRDVRGGQGERRTFRTILGYLAENSSDVVRKNLHLIPEYGRWDDILTLFGTPIEDDALAFIRQSLVVDKNALCAKWMPREKSSKRAMAVKIRKAMDVSSKQYRQLLSGLTKVVETQMCEKKWDEINFEHVPSYAMKNYRKAFARHDEERWGKYISALEKGDAKVNASTLYPHDLVRQVNLYNPQHDKLIQGQWDALPNYLKGNKERMITVNDVSGSMSGVPMEVCIALGLYISERNEGIFKDAFITFSANPTMQHLKGKTLAERVGQLRRAQWSMNTDLAKVFEVLLSKAKTHDVSPDLMPTMVLILSDMQFDSCIHNGKSVTAMNKIRGEYESAGYELPKVTFWNLRAVPGNNPVKFNEQGTALVSGFSPSILTQLLSGDNITPYAIMRKTIDSDRYSKVTV
jgi:hypothetical protein